MIPYFFLRKWNVWETPKSYISRSPVFAARDHTDIIVRQVMEDIGDVALAQMLKIATEDKNYQEVVTTILSGKYDGKKIKKTEQILPRSTMPHLLGLPQGQRDIPYILQMDGCPKGGSSWGAVQPTHPTHRDVEDTNVC